MDMKLDLTNDKIRVFNTLILGIETAIEQKSARLFVKGMLVLGDKLDVLAERSEWLMVLKKAQDFFESIEDYEKCAKCKDLAEYIKNNNLDTDANDESEEASDAVA
jgi:hypothetical protein